MEFDTKIAIILREDLATWQKLNVTSFLTSGILGANPSLLGEEYRAVSYTHLTLPTNREV